MCRTQDRGILEEDSKGAISSIFNSKLTRANLNSINSKMKWGNWYLLPPLPTKCNREVTTTLKILMHSLTSNSSKNISSHMETVAGSLVNMDGSLDQGTRQSHLIKSVLCRLNREKR
jgi:hypothetical protein